MRPFLPRSVLSALLFVTACGVPVGEPEDISTTGDALTGPVPIGSTLRATGNVNMRSGPGTSYGIEDVVTKGDDVTTVNTTQPNGRFYNVSYNGQTGWVSGLYLKLISSPQPGTGGGAGGGSASGGGSSGGGGTLPMDCGNLNSEFTCTADGSARQRCNSGSAEVEACSRGCLREPSGTDAICMTSSWPLSCGGTYGTKRSTAGDYYITAFGCWKDANGAIHTDSGDNCIPSCLTQAKSSGLCAGMSGPGCEESVTWYTADAARFGCLARLKITNPANGKAVIAVALDYGPACWVENNVNFPVLDASGRVNRYLFGEDHGAVDRAKIHVVEVDPSTPLGPVQ